ncbi:hypothetical protein K469DRAFT_708761 [Zopfia rhizophila CBS 207.26]|uniref:NADP-dependent oxidoreductase domain-containing protein n=1 Tax=Zopfia rhizophila CBS 207.26 TaxID=1314779 RepID=A0A6A6E359_9PEZI|nr:hypothetical protein K469DRAFT_708761 [Zopfia rhizophila CBS 207.26]
MGVQKGMVVLPKSVTPSRVKSNLEAKELPSDVFEAPNDMETHKRFNVQARWGFDPFEELSNEEVKKIAKEAGLEYLTKFTA